MCFLEKDLELFFYTVFLLLNPSDLACYGVKTVFYTIT